MSQLRKVASRRAGSATRSGAAGVGAACCEYLEGHAAIERTALSTLAAANGSCSLGAKAVVADATDEARPSWARYLY